MNHYYITTMLVGVVAFLSAINPEYQIVAMGLVLFFSSMYYWLTTKATLGLVGFNIYPVKNILPPAIEQITNLVLMLTIFDLDNIEAIMIFAYAIPWYLSSMVSFVMVSLITVGWIEYKELNEDEDETY